MRAIGTAGWTGAQWADITNVRRAEPRRTAGAIWYIWEKGLGTHMRRAFTGEHLSSAHGPARWSGSTKRAHAAQHVTAHGHPFRAQCTVGSRDRMERSLRVRGSAPLELVRQSPD